MSNQSIPHAVKEGASQAFTRYAWGVLGFNLLVVLWGAYVRATGSGAGCGSHWPLCNGTVLPREPAVETFIEFTHRTTSGLALLAVLGMWVWARRAFPSGSIVRTGAAFSLVFIVIEALLGAGLVLFELVADDASMFRAASMVAHLVNTFILIAFLALTAWWASGGSVPRIAGNRGVATVLASLGVGLLLVGATGAIAALGDTLFPSTSLPAGLRESFSSEAHPLVQLRKYHPLLAIVVGLAVVLFARRTAGHGSSQVLRRLALTLGILYIGQLLLGVVNVVLLAPVAMQLVHLLAADLVWIAFILFAATALGAEATTSPRVGGGSPTPRAERAAGTIHRDEPGVPRSRRTALGTRSTGNAGS